LLQAGRQESPVAPVLFIGMVMKTKIFELYGYFTFAGVVTLLAFVYPQALEFLRIIPKTPTWRDYKVAIDKAKKEIPEEVEELQEIEIEIEIEETCPKIIEEAIGGICYLGFKKTEAKKVVNRVCNDYVFTDAEELIKAALDRSNV
jgi:hypothetical protein